MSGISHLCGGSGVNWKELEKMIKHNKDRCGKDETNLYGTHHVLKACIVIKLNFGPDIQIVQGFQKKTT